MKTEYAAPLAIVLIVLAGFAAVIATTVRAPTDGLLTVNGGKFVLNGSPVVLTGLDENTAFTYNVLGVFGPNQNFPSGPVTTIPGVTDADSFWKEYFRYFLHYQQTGTPRPNMLRVWVQDDNWCSCAQDLWASDPAAFYGIFDRMTYWAHRAGVYVVPILGSNVAPNAMFDRTSGTYAARVAFERALMAHGEPDPGIAMFDLFNEADSHFGTVSAYRSWMAGLVADVRGASSRPITVGHIGLSRGFGFDEATYRAYNDVPGLDVAHEHAYFSVEDQYLIDWRAGWARSLGKPYFIGEFGYNGNGPYGYWPWFAAKWGAADVGPSAPMVWYGAGKGSYADYAYLGPLPEYPPEGPPPPPPPPPDPAVDVTPPARVTDLKVVATGRQYVTLQWTAPGDDGLEGRAQWYDVRYSLTGPITEETFDAATHVEIPFFPHSPGQGEGVTIPGLSRFTTYWFALRTSDEVPNWSLTSNSVSTKTL
jgi:hypothetical protein